MDIYARPVAIAERVRKVVEEYNKSPRPGAAYLASVRY
jgi:hypothetical protein